MSDKNLVYIPIEELYPHPDNPRKDLGDLSELSESIRANGVLQNLTVVPDTASGTGYTVIIGHRRLAAAKIAGLTELPCIVAEMTEKEQLSTMLVENMQRSDLTIYEQAQGFQLMLDMGESVDQIAEKSGFSKATVRRRLKMGELDPETLKEVSTRQLSITDFDKLAQIESLETRNSVLKDIGTFNFDNAVARAVRAEHREKVTPEAKKQIKKLGLKPIAESDRYSAKYDSVKSINLNTWNPDDGFGIEDSTGMLYFLSNWGDLTFYRKRPKAAAAKKSAAQIAEEKAVARALASVKEETEITYELRKTFIDSLHVTQKNIGLMLRGAAIGTVAGAALYKSADRNAILRLVDIDPDGKWDDVRSGAVNAAVSLDNDDLIPAIIYAQFQDSKNNGYYTAYKTEWLRHDKNLMLDALYAWLISMGYEMSDDEKALQNGTHELFKEATE